MLVYSIDTQTARSRVEEDGPECANSNIPFSSTTYQVGYPKHIRVHSLCSYQLICYVYTLAAHSVWHYNSQKRKSNCKNVTEALHQFKTMSARAHLWSQSPHCHLDQISQSPFEPEDSVEALAAPWTHPHSTSHSYPSPISENVSPAAWFLQDQLHTTTENNPWAWLERYIRPVLPPINEPDYVLWTLQAYGLSWQTLQLLLLHVVIPRSIGIDESLPCKRNVTWWQSQVAPSMNLDG